jgi:hypothetical protein
VRVERSGEVVRWRWCGFNVSVLTRGWRRRDEALPEGEAETVSLSWFYGKKV